jgi:hypothetical protein
MSCATIVVMHSEFWSVVGCQATKAGEILKIIFSISKTKHMSKTHEL